MHRIVLPLFAFFALNFAASQTEVVWWHALGGALGESLEQIADEFNALQSDYKVTAIYRGTYDEAMTTAMAAFRSGEQPHILQVYEVGTATMMASPGAIYPVHELMADLGKPFEQEAFVPGVISYYVSADGNLLSMPFNTSTPVMWVNLDALESFGAEIPTTWDDLAAVGRAARAAGYPCGFSFGWTPWVMLENYAAWHNLPFATLDNGFGGMGTELLINSEEIINHVQRLGDLSREGVFVYAGRRGDSLPVFLNQECPIWMNSSAYYNGISRDADFRFTQSFLPLDTAVASEPQNSIIGGATLWVLRGHSQAEYEGVAAFFEYLSSVEVQAWWHQTTGYVPITTAAYDATLAAGFYDEFPGTDISVRQLSLNPPTDISRGVRLGNFVQIRDVLYEEMEAVFSGQKPGEQAMNDAVRRSNDLLRRFEAANR